MEIIVSSLQDHLLNYKLKFPPTIIDILNSNYNELLLATTNGLFKYNLSTKKLIYTGNLSPSISLNKEVNYDEDMDHSGHAV